VIIALLFGDVGYPAPGASFIVEVSALVCLCVWATVIPRRSPRRPLDAVIIGLAAVLIAVPLIQLIPLPPGLWHSLPGRDIELQSLQTIGASNVWMPISIAPWRTIAAALALIPLLAMLAMLAMVTRLSIDERALLLRVLVVLALVAALLGAVQVMSGTYALRFYSQNSPGFAVGFRLTKTPMPMCC
jgi:hypothetical protein